MERTVKILDVLGLERTALVTENVTVGRTNVSVQMAGQAMAVTFQIVLGILIVPTGATATQLLTLPFVLIVHLVGWGLLVRISVHTGIKYRWTVETVFAIHVTQVEAVMSSAQDTEHVIITNACVIQFKDGGVPFARCLGAQDRMEKIVVDTENVEAQTMSVFVIQVGLVQGAISRTVPVFQTALDVVTATQQIA